MFQIMQICVSVSRGLYSLETFPRYHCEKRILRRDENCRAPSLYVFHITVWLHFKKKKNCPERKMIPETGFYVFTSWTQRDQEQGCCGFCAVDVLQVLMNQPTSNILGILNHCKNLGGKGHLITFVICSHFCQLWHLFGHASTPFKVNRRAPL